MILAIAGGMTDTRDRVVRYLKRERVGLFRLPVPKSGELYLSGAEKRNRLGQLEQVIAATGPDDVLVIDYLASPEEAEKVREVGGFVWSIAGRPSSTVPHDPSCDLHVWGATRPRDRDYKLLPDEALQACLMRCQPQ